MHIYHFNCKLAYFCSNIFLNSTMLQFSKAFCVIVALKYSFEKTQSTHSLAKRPISGAFHQPPCRIDASPDKPHTKHVVPNSLITQERGHKTVAEPMLE
uniref:Uncharacterized protein n=1 Tax=Oryza brachyantha TaxID=4533 RepID=J3ND14_ORYBR